MLRRVAAPLAGAVIGLVAFASGLGFAIANPSRTSWVLVEGDHRIHFIGWHMFRHEAWAMPPGAIESYGYPLGTSIAYTDSIPILAFLFKLARPALSSDFQYLGLWLLIAYVLQGVFAVLLLRTATANPFLQTLGAAIFVLSPPLLFRYGHPALSAHWLLLAGLYLYFRLKRFSTAVVTGWTITAAIAACTHPYIAMMIVILATAHHGRLALAASRRDIIFLALSLLTVGVVVGTAFWSAGYFVIGGSGNVQGPGLGLFSMNALALIMPIEGSALFGQGPFAYATLGQYEGYAYFGAGALLLLIVASVAALLRWRPAAGATSRIVPHLPLTLACTFLLVMALSPKVTAGARVLFEYNESWWGPLTVFRASGRMFWPVFYLLMFGVLAAIGRWFRFRMALLLVGAAVLLQTADLSPVFSTLRHVRLRNWQSPLHADLWSVVPHYEHLILIPTNICTAPPEAIDYTPFAVIAGRAGTTLNAGFAARYDVASVTRYCHDAGMRWNGGDVRDDELYVLRPALAGQWKQLARAPLVCVPADSYEVCFTAASYRRWQHSYDLVRRTLASPEEIARMQLALEAVYRDSLQRPATTLSPPMPEASEWIARYLSYRVTGCSHDEAVDKIRDQIGGGNSLRLCRAGYTARFDMPPVSDTLRFRVELQQMVGPGAAGPTHLDLEGQAVWIQEYVRLRRVGRTEADAIEEVRAAVHRAAGR